MERTQTWEPHAEGVAVTRMSRITGKLNTLVLPMTVEEFEEGMSDWMDYAYVLIQDAFPTLDADQREFLMTGMTPEEWQEIFGAEEEEEGA